MNYCSGSLLRIWWHYRPSCVTLFCLPGYLDAEIPSNGSRFWSLWAGSSNQLASVLDHPLSFPDLKSNKSQEISPEHKVDMPKSNTTKIWTPIIDKYVVRCGSKTGTKKTCLQKIGLHAANILNHSRLKSQTWFGDLYDHLMSRIIFTLIMDEIFMRAWKIWGISLWPRFEFSNHLSLIECFISYKKWVQIEKYQNNTHLP